MSNKQPGSPNWVVLKFGGSSVSRALNWPTIHRLVQQSLDAAERPVVVMSALSDVSNLLEDTVYASSETARRDCLDNIRARHMAAWGVIAESSAMRLKFPEQISSIISSFSCPIGAGTFSNC